MKKWRENDVAMPNQTKNVDEVIVFNKLHLTSKGGRLWVNGASVEHSHDLANKVFGNEISKW